MIDRTQRELAKYEDVRGLLQERFDATRIARSTSVLTPGRYVGAEEVEEDGERRHRRPLPFHLFRRHPHRLAAAPLGEVVSYLKRGIGPTYVDARGVRVVNQKCIRGGRVDFTKSRRHDESRRSVQDRLLLVGDVLVNSTGVGTLGRVAQVRRLAEPTIADSHVTVVRARVDTLRSELLGIGLEMRESEIEALGEGSTGQTELSRERLSLMTTIVPSMAVQAAFATIVIPLRERTSNNVEESATLAALRDLLLPKLLSGELRVRDAERAVAEAV
jgi:type I restriction enzyme S subunit